MGKLDFFKIKKKKSASKDTIGKADAPCTLARGRMGNLFGDPIYRSSARHTARLRYSTGDHGRGPFLPPPPPRSSAGHSVMWGGHPRQCPHLPGSIPLLSGAPPHPWDPEKTVTNPKPHALWRAWSPLGGLLLQGRAHGPLCFPLWLPHWCLVLGPLRRPLT